MSTSAQERSIIRKLKRRLAVHPRSRSIKKSLARHRATQRRLAPVLRQRAWQQMVELIKERVTEQGGNNRGARVEEIIRANGGTPGEPWCGDTVAYCYLRAGAKSVVRAWAGVSWLEKLLTRVRIPRLGHVVTYKWSHTGLFKRWLTKAERARYQVPRGSFWAGEGNTGADGRTSDQTGGRDGVHLRIRNRADVVGFYRVIR